MHEVQVVGVDVQVRQGVEQLMHWLLTFTNFVGQVETQVPRLRNLPVGHTHLPLVGIESAGQKS